jgi:hypothetical protein
MILQFNVILVKDISQVLRLKIVRYFSMALILIQIDTTSLLKKPFKYLIQMKLRETNRNNSKTKSITRL